MIKIKDFIKTKLENFKKFLLEQIDILDKKIILYNKDGINTLIKELDYYIENLDKFISSISLLNKNTDDNIKLYLSQYSIDINDIKDHIDYEKLKRYIECFLDCIKK